MTKLDPAMKLNDKALEGEIERILIQDGRTGIDQLVSELASLYCRASPAPSSDLVERLEKCATKLEGLETLPKPYDLYYAVKNDAPGWSYHCAHIGVSDIREAATLIAELEGALLSAAGTLEGLSYIHDSNPSDAMADMPAVEYARHMLYEARKIARDAHSEARRALASIRGGA